MPRKQMTTSAPAHITQLCEALETLHSDIQKSQKHIHYYIAGDLTIPPFGDLPEYQIFKIHPQDILIRAVFFSPTVWMWWNTVCFIWRAQTNP